MGVALFRYVVAEPAFRAAAIDGSAAVRRYRSALATVLWAGLALAILSGVAWLLALAAEIGRQGSVTWLLLTRTSFGHLWIVRAFLAALLSGALWRGKEGAATVIALGLMGSLAWSGHAAGSPGPEGDFHRAADLLHVVAAGAWLGGLLALALLFMLAMRQTDSALTSVLPAATRRFSSLGLLSVGTLLVTGLINTWMLAGGPDNLVTTDYGRLLLLKITLFAVMATFAGINRRRLMPTLPGTDAIRRLSRNARIELVLGLAIITVVGILGMLPPAAHSGMHMHMH